MNPISVVLTYHNETDYVRAAIASIERQTHPAVELILVDDGAPTPLASLLDTSAMQLVRQENGGDGAARNAGLRQARHDFIAFMDADDLWPRDRLLQLGRALEDHPGAGIAYGMVEQFISPELPESVKQSLNCPTQAMVGYAPTGMLIDRSVFDRVGLFVEDHEIHGCMEWLSRVRAEKLFEVSIQDIVLRRRLHENNMSRQVERKNLRMLRSLRKKIQRNRQEG